MKKINQTLIVLFALFIFEACKKDKSTADKSPDDITFQEFDPAPELTSVDSIVEVWGPGEIIYQPYPLDSTSSYLLDIDNDSNADFQFTVNNWYQFVSASGPNANYNFDMSVSGVNSNAEIAMVAGSQNNARFYNQDEVIDQQSTWTNGARLWHTGGFASSYYTSFVGTQYIGLRVKNASHYNYCWLKISRNAEEHKLSILSLGYNKTNGNNILAGQH